MSANARAVKAARYATSTSAVDGECGGCLSWWSAVCRPPPSVTEPIGELLNPDWLRDLVKADARLVLVSVDNVGGLGLLVVSRSTLQRNVSGAQRGCSALHVPALVRPGASEAYVGDAHLRHVLQVRQLLSVVSRPSAGKEASYLSPELSGALLQGAVLASELPHRYTPVTHSGARRSGAWPRTCGELSITSWGRSGEGTSRF